MISFNHFGNSDYFDHNDFNHLYKFDPSDLLDYSDQPMLTRNINQYLDVNTFNHFDQLY